MKQNWKKKTWKVFFGCQSIGHTNWYVILPNDLNTSLEGVCEGTNLAKIFQSCHFNIFGINHRCLRKTPYRKIMNNRDCWSVHHFPCCWLCSTYQLQECFCTKKWHLMIPLSYLVILNRNIFDLVWSRDGFLSVACFIFNVNFRMSAMSLLRLYIKPLYRSYYY